MGELEWLESEDPGAMVTWLTTGRRWGEPVSNRKSRLFACACARQVWFLLPDRRCQRAVEVGECYADGRATDEERLDALHAASDVCDGIEVAGEETNFARAVLAQNCARREVPFGLPASRQVLFPEVVVWVIRDLVGNPFRPVFLPWRCRDCGIPCGPPGAPDAPGAGRTAGHFCVRCGADATRCVAFSPDAQSVARACYEERLPAGLLDRGRMRVLADALEEAGCDEERLLWHLRCVCDVCDGEGTLYDTAGEDLDGRGGREVRVECFRCGGNGLNLAPHFRGCWAVDLVLGLA